MSEQNQGPITEPTKTEDGKLLLPLPALKNKDRFTMTLNAHHEHRGDPPTSVTVVASTLLETFGVEPWGPKRLEVGEEWKPLLTNCWVDESEIGYIFIENRTGLDLVSYPSDDERKAIEAAVVKVAYDHESSSSFLILPRLVLPIYPTNASRLFVRCVKGSAKVRVTVFPR